LSDTERKESSVCQKEIFTAIPTCSHSEEGNTPQLSSENRSGSGVHVHRQKRAHQNVRGSVGSKSGIHPPETRPENVASWSEIELQLFKRVTQVVSKGLEWVKIAFSRLERPALQLVHQRRYAL
jgi:hypothetical protein